MAGFNFTYGTSGTAYVISSVPSTSQILLIGNASGEATGDTYAVDNMEDYDLPDGFGKFISPMTFAPGSNCESLEYTMEGRIRTLRDTQDSGAPYLAAVRQRTFDAATAGTRWELMLYPRPDTTYTLTAQCSILPDMLTSVALYPYGGPIFASAIKAACLMVVESDVNLVVNGQMSMLFQERLKAALDADLMGGPDVFGYNGNPTPYTGYYNPWLWQYTAPTPYNGNPWSGP